jgi:hypothetical protein
MRIHCLLLPVRGAHSCLSAARVKRVRTHQEVSPYRPPKGYLELWGDPRMRRHSGSLGVSYTVRERSGYRCGSNI